jgi:hypothetical protein
VALRGGLGAVTLCVTSAVLPVPPASASNVSVQISSYLLFRTREVFGAGDAVTFVVECSVTVLPDAARIPVDTHVRCGYTDGDGVSKVNDNLTVEEASRDSLLRQGPTPAHVTQIHGSGVPPVTGCVTAVVQFVDTSSLTVGPVCRRVAV